jgi:hypothetical protein
VSLRGFELYYDGAWQPVNAYEQEGWKYKAGPSDLTGQEPGQLSFTLANDDLSMDPSNPRSPLYGKIGPNTPARMLMYTPATPTVSATFGSTASSSWPNTDTGQVWTTAGGSASDYSSSGGVGRMSLGSINASRRATLNGFGTVTSGEISVRITIPVDPTGDDIETTIMFQYQDASNYLQASIYWDRDGRPIELRFVRRQAGVVTDLAIGHLAVSPTGASLSCNLKLRWFDREMSLKAWPSAGSEPSNWTISARDSTWLSGGLIGLRANLQPLFAGGTPQVVTFDNFTYSPYVAEAVFTGEAGSWRPETTPEHVPGLRGRSWTALDADDLLRRIGKAGDLGTSPLRRQISSYTSLLGYWPMEEGSEAKNFANLATSSNRGSFTTGLVDLAANDGPAGGFNAPVVSDGAVLGGRFTFDTSTDGYQLSFCMKLDAAPSSSTFIAMFQWSDTMQRTWYWRINNTSFQVAAYDDFSTLLASQNATYGTGMDPTQWVRYRIKVSVSGSTVSFEPAWYMQDAITSYGFTGTFTNVSVGYPIGWQIVANTYTDKAAFGHVFGISDLSLDLVNSEDARNPFNAYNGESAYSRFVRLMRESGYGFYIRGDITKASLLGRQPRGSLAEILQEMQVSEGGIIYGDPARVRPIFRLNDDLINQTPVMTLTKGTNLGYPFKKVIDDQRAANDITVKNWDDTEVRVVKETGSRNVQEPPVGVGRYPGTLEVSLYWPESLEQRGSWELANNTLDRPRYPTVIVDLLASPSLAAAADVIQPGDIVAINGEEPTTIYLIVVNVERSGNAVKDTLNLTCLPGEKYMAGVWDDGLHDWDSKSTTLNEDLDLTETGVDIFSADPMDKWSTTPGYQIYIGAELCTVTACTAGSASGAGWAQTMTVTRSVNGIALTHTSGEEVHVSNPGTWVMYNREPV